MSPERPSKSTRRKIRELKREFRSSDQTPEAQNPGQTPWEIMEKILSMRLSDKEITSSGYSIIKDWFETRTETRDKSPQAQDEARTAFAKRYNREDLMEVKAALALITQTVR